MPVKYSPEDEEIIKNEICDKVSQGITIASICRQDGMPNRTTIYRWIDDDKDFMQRIERAREAGFDEIAEECLSIADFTARDTISTEKGDIPDTEWINRSKLRVETRLKLLSKWHPKKYGDKIQNEHSGNIDSSMQLEIVRSVADDE